MKRMQGKYKIAGHVFNVSTLYEDVHILCGDYSTEEAVEFNIETTQTDIREEKNATEKECQKENISVPFITDGMYESTAVYAKVVELLFPYNIILFHGSVIAVDDCAYMFIAKSGTGKSTHTRMWRELLGSKTVMVNDDKPLVQIADNEVLAYGTPWNGKHNIGNNITVPLKGICILRRGSDNTIQPVNLAEVYPMLLQQVYRMTDRESMKKEMELIDKMAHCVRFYDMTCNISIEAAEMAYQTMHEGANPK